MKNNLNRTYHELISSIIKSLKDEEVNSKYKLFIKALIDFCSNETKLVSIYRILKEINFDISIEEKKICITSDAIDCIIQKVHSFLDTEIEIIIFKIKNPDLSEVDSNPSSNAPPLELLIWTDDKIALVELIYGVAKSSNRGRASIKRITACFEYIFQVKLGSVYDILGEINIRTKDTTRYLDSLPDRLREALNKINNK